MTNEEKDALAVKYADKFVRTISYPPDINSIWKTAYKSFLDGINYALYNNQNT